MLVYLIMLALLSVILLLEKSLVPQGMIGNQKRQSLPKKIFVWIIFFILAFVAMFRYGVGTDFYAYYKNDSWINKFEEQNYNTPGFTLFAIICNTLFGGRDGAITMGAALVTVALFVFTIAKRSENLPISILLFVLAGCFTGMFNGIRQYLATAILFAGYHFVIDKKPFKWLLIVLLAASFHITAILMFFVYFICNLKCDWKLIIIYIAVAVILLFAYEPLFDLVGALKQDEIDMDAEYMTGSVNRLRVLVQCVPIIMMFFVNKTKLNQDKEARFLFNICLLNGAIAIAAMNSPYLSRFWIYTSCFQILMFPKIFNKMNKNDRLLFTVLLIVFYGLFWGYEIINSSALRNFSWIFKYL